MPKLCMSKTSAVACSLLWLLQRSGSAFVPPTGGNSQAGRTSHLAAAPKRLEENVDGVLYVNDKCINCAACANFAPSVFGRADHDAVHVVHHQPSLEDLDKARAALAACPVAAIRVETEAHRRHRDMPSLSQEEKDLAKSLALSPKVNGLELPFPRPFARDAYYIGHHSDATFGAIPFLVMGMFQNKQVWVMVDTPKFNPSSVRTVTSLTGPQGPDFLFLTHVDDTAGHQEWAKEFSSLKRIFHSGDLGKYNWIGDESLNDVEVLLEGSAQDEGLKTWALDGGSASKEDDFVIWHTPGHSPGSISLLKKGSPGILFTGDTYAYSTRNGGGMSGFPRYNSGGRELQAKTLQLIVDNSNQWDMIAPGHGHPRDYRDVPNKQEMKQQDLSHAVKELTSYSRW